LKIKNTVQIISLYFKFWQEHHDNFVNHWIIVVDSFIERSWLNSIPYCCNLKLVFVSALFWYLLPVSLSSHCFAPSFVYRFDRDWKKIEAFVGSKTVIQVILMSKNPFFG